LKDQFEGYRRQNVALDLAEAAENTHREFALRIYIGEVEGLLRQRGRNKYQTACGLLKRMQPMYQTAGRSDQFQKLLTRLRQEHRALRAFHEELARAGLSLNRPE
jgi:uncharacterized Zn finger protein